MGGTPPLSPLAPKAFPDLPEIGGVRFATAEAGVRYSGRPDVMLAELAPGTKMAGVFTRSATRSAAVLDCQEKIGFQSEAGPRSWSIPAIPMPSPGAAGPRR
jgi:glutamate N-acetyltransferase/amino-acid N-acetyltransferase